ncbi:hypothetical protein [Vibrio cholerae]|uniref:hypothetical protein n=1 Tax=Vibrio cholerae TaxID=666 RepID=UPI0011D37419|nr:hypothetical protein [Vibrio cholerae]TXX83738.1 hypothetical protein FXE94_09315 [Vibrio cholerae]GHY51722.1 hypothetical protein VCSRO119_2428 [Vibrio cholerae]GIA58478.1 hypothetical protein VCSRO87_2108 [Vibrio cholerae]
MQVKELLNLTYWVDKNIKHQNVIQKYQQLTDIIQQNVHNGSKQPFALQQSQLIDSIKLINTNTLTYAQEEMLKKLGLHQHIGTWGVEKLEDILFRNNLDIANAYSELDKIIRQINDGISRSNQIQTQLEPIISLDSDDDTLTDDVMMRVHFQNDVPLENVADFKKWGTVWFDIGRGIALAHDNPPEAIRVVGAQKGSIIIELATAAAIATSISTIILSALKVAERVLKIKKEVEEIKKLKLSNKKLELDLEKEVDEEKKIGLEAINKEILSNLKLEVNGDGEKINALNKAIKNLLDFIEKGGEIDFVVSDDNKGAEELEQLRINFSEIKQLENRLLALENKIHN